MSRIGSGLRKIVKIFKEEKKIPVIERVLDSEQLKGKVALLTGGSGGIGMAIARKFLESGAKVIIVGTNQEKLKKCLETLADSDNTRALCMNVADVKMIPEKISEAIGLFPESRIDILVNGAGIIAKNKFFDMTEEEYDRVMDINAKGTFFVSQSVSKHMIENGIRGHILNFSSASALRPAITPYHMSKWAVRGFTVGLADILLPHGIVVNAIGPGPTATSMLGKSDNDSIYHSTNPSGRYATPEEIANLALFMVSGMGDLIVGDTYYITGGSGITSYHD